jgi:hypothetical protein
MTLLSYEVKLSTYTFTRKDKNHKLLILNVMQNQIQNIGD